jgi:hypothetical protein
MKKISSSLRDGLYVIVLFSFIFLVLDSCKKSHPPGGRAAQGTLQGVDGNCLPGTVHGTWYAGVNAGGDTNYVEIGVDVSRTGSYRITSNAQNGVIFSDSGQFTSTGLQTVRLKASGAFTVVGIANFSITFDSSACGFSVNVKAPPLTDNTWRCTFGGRTYWGSASAIVTFFTGDNAFDLNGTYALSSDTTLSFRERMPQRSDGFGVTLGTYLSSSPGAHFFLQANGVPFLRAQPGLSQVMTIVVTGVFYAPNGAAQYEGTFSGTCVDENGGTIEIRDGAFRAGA